MKTIKKVSIQAQIIESIKEYIKENNLKSGNQLPSQMQMIKNFGVSRSSLREALKTLEAYGVIEVLIGKGVFVKNPSSDPLSSQAREKEALLEVLHVRKILEKEIIRLVVENATEKELNEIRECLDKLMVKYKKGVTQTSEDKKFHMTLYKYCHNKVMIQLINSMDNVFNKLWMHPLGMPDPFLKTIPMHKEMFEMICKRDIKKAQAINAKTINVIIDEIVKF